MGDLIGFFQIMSAVNTALLMWLIKGQSDLSNRVSRLEGKLSPYRFVNRFEDMPEENGNHN